MADYMISNDQDLINADEEFELDFSQEEFESILNECTSESTYAYFSRTSRLKVRGEVNKIDDRTMKLNSDIFQSYLAMSFVYAKTVCIIVSNMENRLTLRTS